MILGTELVKSACDKILKAIDNSNNSNLNGMLELKTENSFLFLNVTNKEYFVKVCLGNCSEEFHATVAADLFLKLISQVTSDDIEFKCNKNILVVKANGTYKFPLIYENTEILSLPTISINNPTINFKIDSSILNSILIHNAKELSKVPKNNKIVVHPIQKMYYMDEQGAITFYNGACVNKFTLEKPVKVLLNSNLVKLFSLFKNTAVDFTLGYDALSETIIQTKVKFSTADIEITAILNCDDSLIKAMPAQAIRDRAFNLYPYSVTLNRAEFLNAIQRVLLFTTTDIGAIKSVGKFIFEKASCKLADISGENTETINYANELATDLAYETTMDLTDLKLALETNTDQYVTLNFGDHAATVVAKDNIYTVVPEISI